MTMASQQPQSVKRMQSGIPGLDTLLGGGFPQNGVYIILGPPGTGKTIISNQICFAHVASGGRAVYITLLAETHASMLIHLQELAFFKREIIADSLNYFSGYRALADEGLSGFNDFIRRIVRDLAPTLLVIDGLATIASAGVSDHELQQFIHQLQMIGAFHECTMLLCTHLPIDAAPHPEHPMVDGMIELSNQLIGLRAVREIQINKLRGTNHLNGRHTFEITQTGVVVYPRIETRVLTPASASDPLPERKRFGISQLDTMLNGGLPMHESTMIVGTTGSGKTLLGLQFLVAGVAEGQRGLYVGFYETPQELCVKGDGVGMNLSEHTASGQITLVWNPPYERLLDAIAEQILQIVRERQVQRLFLDGVEGLQEIAVYPGRLTRFMSALSNALRDEGVTMLFSIEIRDLVGPTVKIPIEGASTVAGNIILLRQAELQSQNAHILSIVKMRLSGFDSTIRSFIIGSQGIVVDDTVDRAEALLTGTARPRPTRGRTRRR